MDEHMLEELEGPLKEKEMWEAFRVISLKAKASHFKILQ